MSKECTHYQGKLTCEEDSASHLGVSFLPFNPKDGKIFLVHHKKSKLWIAPGGHVNKNETLLDTLNRELEEELGIKNKFAYLPNPFFISITKIKDPKRICREHFDVWYLVETGSAEVNVDMNEFLDVKWLLPREARNIVTDPLNLSSIDLFEKFCKK